MRDRLVGLGALSPCAETPTGNAEAAKSTRLDGRRRSNYQRGCQPLTAAGGAGPATRYRTHDEDEDSGQWGTEHADEDSRLATHIPRSAGSLRRRTPWWLTSRGSRRCVRRLNLTARRGTPWRARSRGSMAAREPPTVGQAVGSAAAAAEPRHGAAPLGPTACPTGRGAEGRGHSASMPLSPSEK